MGRAIFQIINGDDKVDLLGKKSGICIQQWAPARMQMKDGGIFTESPMSDGRNLTDYHLTNWVETITFASRANSTDSLITLYARKLDELLIKALDYWSKPHQSTPTYIKAKSSKETNARYAVIKSVTFPDDSNPYASPFVSGFCKAAKTGIDLEIEHGGWFSEAPDESTCVQVSGSYPYGSAFAEFEPSASDDDATADNSTNTLNLTQTFLINDSDNDLGIRFLNVTIPQGATINDARLLLTSRSVSSLEIIVTVEGEDADTSAAFTNYANFTGRARTSNSLLWQLPAVSTLRRYESPNINDVIQEIVDRVGWSSGNDLSLFMMYSSGPGNRLWASVDYLSGVHQAVLQVTYQDGSDRGQEATCEPQVFVSNRETIAPLTHIYNYDADVGFEGTNYVNSTSFTMFSSLGAAVGDIIYFGNKFGTSDDEGPFNSLVFDIATAMAGTYTIVREYYNGAWVSLTVQDNSQDFQNDGVSSIHWNPQSDWAPTTINGARALWVRARLSAVTSITASPIIQNRSIYSINWPKLSVDSSQVGGDLPAYMEMIHRGVSGDLGTGILDASGFFCGVRSASRGGNFQSYINVNNNHNFSGVGYSTHVGILTVDARSPGGLVHGAPSTVSPTKIAYISFDEIIAPQYKGSYAVIVRTLSDFSGYLSLSLEDTPDDDIVVGDNVVSVRTGGLIYSAMGRWSIPGVPSRLNIWATDLITTSITDVILIPADEFAAHVYYANRDQDALPITETGTTPARLTWGNQNLTDANEWMIARLRKNSNLGIVTEYITRANSFANLLPNKDQNIYFFFTQDNSVDTTLGTVTANNDATIFKDTDTYTGTNANDDASLNASTSTETLGNATEDFGSAGKFGVIFRSISLPQGAEIIDARLNFTAAANATPASAFVTGIDEDNTTAPFTGVFPDLDNRARTDAFVSWTAPAWVNGNTYETSSLRKIVQEIVDRPGWSTGNNMGFIISSGSASQTFDTFDTSLTSISLDITWRKYDSTQTTSVFSLNGRYGVQFTGVNVPRGAIINSASLSFEASNPSATAIIGDVLVSGEDDGDPGAFTSFSDLDGRKRTAASIVWTPTAWVDGTRYDTDDISEIVREIISRDDWDSGNDMAFILNGGSDSMLFKTEDQAAGADRPELDIEYTVFHNECREAVSNSITITKNQRYTSMRGDS